MNVPTKRLKNDAQLSLAESADVPRRGYFVENRKPLAESKLPHLGIGGADLDPCWERFANAPIESANIPSQRHLVAPHAALGQPTHESFDDLDDSGEETEDEDWKTVGAVGLLSQHGLKSGVEVVAVKTVKGQSSETDAKEGKDVAPKEAKPQAKKGNSAPRKARKKTSHNRKDQSDPTLAPWAVKAENIPDDGQLRSEYRFHFQHHDACNRGR